MDNQKKPKLVIKKSSKSGTIADKISQGKKEEEEKRAQEALVRRQEVARKKEEERLHMEEAKKNSVPQTEKISGHPEKPETPPPVLEAEPAEPAKETKPATETETTATKKKKKQKQNFREDILKKEEHKKFFMNQKSRPGMAPPPEEKKKVEPRSSIPKDIKITEFIQVGELARKLNIKTSEIISKLMAMGVMATITQSIDADTATLLSSEYGCSVKVVSLYDETLIQEEEDTQESLVIRPPVVTVMGHVDHGKTKLLDAIRKTDVVSTEAGGITQHIGAYQISTDRGKITFLDTPGHEAFTAMRARGAEITDIVILVVAADSGVMPTTVEAIKHAKEAKVPIIVAINKIDLPNANVDKVKQELSVHDLIPEDWGGSVPMVEVSAKQGLNIDKLEDVVLTQSEIMELKANPHKKAIGTVVEAKLDQGRGPVATVLISSGTLKVGDPFVVGMEGGKIRAMLNDRGHKILGAPPAMPVEILGLTGVPNAGDPFHVMESERESKDIIEKRQELNRQQQAQKIKKVKLENLNEIIEEGKIQEFKIIIKADVRGSVEALQSSLEKISNNEIKVNIIYGSTGEITESDVMLASAANAIIIGFNTRANAKVRDVAVKEGIEIKYYSIIYQAIDDVKNAIEGLLSPDIKEEILGEAEVRETFRISSVGTVGGCFVRNGVIQRNSPVRLIRDGVVIYTGSIKTLKRFQNDTNEVKEGFECGILIEGYNDLKNGDIIECFHNVETSRDIDKILRDESAVRNLKKAEAGNE